MFLNKDASSALKNPTTKKMRMSIVPSKRGMGVFYGDQMFLNEDADSALKNPTIKRMRMSTMPSKRGNLHVCHEGSGPINT